MISIRDKILIAQSEISMLGEHIDTLKRVINDIRTSQKLTKDEKQNLKLAILALEGQNDALWLLTEKFYDKYAKRTLFETQSIKTFNCLHCGTLMQPIKTAYSKPRSIYLSTAYKCSHCGEKHQLITTIKPRKSEFIKSNWQW